MNSASDLVRLAELVNNGNTFADKTINLDIDVDLNNHEWTPIGKGARSGSYYDEAASTPFKGTFDGNNHTISGLYIDSKEPKNTCLGLFGVVDGGTIENLTVNSKIEASQSAVVGSISGLMVNNSIAKNLTVSKGCSINAVEAGGIIGRMTIEGSISSCKNYASVTTTAGGVGGIVGKAYYSRAGKTIKISDCTNYGNIVTDGGYAGGIAGLAAAEVSECTNNGTITGKSTCIGGIVGEFDNYGFVKNSINNGDVLNIGDGSSIYGLGGIVGWIRYQNNILSYGRTENIEISGNTNNANIEGENSSGVGGIVGMLYNTGYIKDNTNNAESLKGALFVSGIVGGHQVDSKNKFSDDESISATEITGNTSITKEESIVGDCVSTIIYINDTRVTKVSNNTPENKTISK